MAGVVSIDRVRGFSNSQLGVSGMRMVLSPPCCGSDHPPGSARGPARRPTPPGPEAVHRKGKSADARRSHAQVHRRGRLPGDRRLPADPDLDRQILSKYNKNIGDFFKGGGKLPWWVGGISAFMAGFSAWMFTGGAGVVYEGGPIGMLALCTGLLGTLFGWLVFARLWRRARVTSMFEYVSHPLQPADPADALLVLPAVQPVLLQHRAAGHRDLYHRRAGGESGGAVRSGCPGTCRFTPSSW